MQLPAVGEVFAGKYAIEAIVGRGGMGVVLAARHLELDERVAIKLILAEDGPKSADFVARFVREAKLASKIKNEHVVRVIDVARLETGEPYIVMELLEGVDLSELLAQRGPLPVDQAALYLLQACEAIAEAHALGIVHRDLKPANMFLTTRRDGQPCVKVLDFGISKLVGGEAGAAMTKTNALMGSPYYMSPDQLVQSRDVDARSDIWALGVILFELLAQKYPFDAEDAPQLIAHILHSAPSPLSSIRSDVPPALVALIDAALVKDRTQRIQDVAEFSHHLAPFAPEAAGRYSLERITGVLGRPPASGTAASYTGRVASPATPVGVPATTARGSTGMPVSRTNPAVSTQHSVSPRGNTPLLIGATAAGVALAIGGFVAFHSKSEASIPVAPVPASVAVTERAAQPPAPPPAAPTVAPSLPAPSPAAPAALAVTAALASSVTPAAAPLEHRPTNPTNHVKPAATHKSPAADPFGGVR